MHLAATTKLQPVQLNMRDSQGRRAGACCPTAGCSSPAERQAENPCRHSREQGPHASSPASTDLTTSTRACPRQVAECITRQMCSPPVQPTAPQTHRPTCWNTGVSPRAGAAGIEARGPSPSGCLDPGTRGSCCSISSAPPFWAASSLVGMPASPVSGFGSGASAGSLKADGCAPALLPLPARPATGQQRPRWRPLLAPLSWHLRQQDRPKQLQVADMQSRAKNARTPRNFFLGVQE